MKLHLSETLFSRGLLMGLRMMLLTLHVGVTIWLAEAWLLREKKGADWCRKKKIGPIREFLKAPPSKLDVVMTRDGCVRVPDHLMDARGILALHCKACGQCERRNEAP